MLPTHLFAGETAMSFSKERAEQIQALIRENLTSGNFNDWERSFLISMEERFGRYGTKTRLSDTQYRTLHKLVKLENGSAVQRAASTNSGQGAFEKQQLSIQPRWTSSTSRSQHKRSGLPRSPLRLINAPRRVIRRVERKLFLPIVLVMGFAGVLGAFFDKTSISPAPSQTVESVRVSQPLNSSYRFVTGSRVNQRAGPGTTNDVMGQLSEGARVRPVAAQDGWTQIVSKLGTGWISSNLLSSAPPTTTESVSTLLASQEPLGFLANVRQVRAGDISVIDGDTVSIKGERANVRLVGFNTPETRSPACPAELEVGRLATSRLRELVRGASYIEFRRVACACRPGTEGTKRCNYGRQCGSIIVDKTNVGRTLISERLAVPYQCGRTSCPPRPGNWCD